MNRGLILLSILILAGSAFAVYTYIQWLEGKEATAARSRAVQAVERSGR